MSRLGHAMPSVTAVVVSVLIRLGAPVECAVASPPVRIEGWTQPPESILDYHLFVDLNRQIPNRGIIPYDLATPHFVDDAILHRFLWIPSGTQVTYTESAALIYPVSTALILSIGYPYDLGDSSRGEQMIETRLLIREEDGWKGLQYVWDPDGADARLSVVGGQREVSWTQLDGTSQTHRYRMPNRNECIQCHRIQGTFVPLGPVNAGYVNRPVSHAGGTTNQLAHWAELGILAGAPRNPDRAPALPIWNDPATGTVADRARAYLDMNCSACHRPGGLAYTSGLDLRYEQHTPVRYGVFKAPVAAGRGIGNTRFSIAPGHPEKSMLVHRMRATDPGIRMPIVGRSRVHEEGIALIGAWISQMDFPDLARAQAASDRRRADRLALLRAGRE